jgi:hypothetical protein
MLIPKKNRREVYKYLFKGAPMVAPSADGGSQKQAARLVLEHDIEH